ncbi:hypothetical protein [Deinococcus sp. Leaf326]|uniref:hypothetical protein n=1 Tax=Deinococcus sp. Leaf326 TaxID=1736338 RepID=UPI0006F8DA94|nr:hypothetical protein [Deinococcus sp. Leaf326]KQR08838.1 hypothetical protein ASF71_10025 [Deinococcus sp. Leaf326]
MTKDQDQSTKLLSDYFLEGAMWGDNQLSPDKLDALLKPELLEGGKFYGKIIPVLDYFYIHTDGEVHPFPSRGEFQKAADKREGWKEERGRKNKQVEYRKAYRNMIIFEVDEFEAWLTRFSKEDSPNPFKLRNAPGTGKKANSQSKFATADFRNMSPEDRLKHAAHYNETLAKRMERGQALGNERKASTQEDTKSKSKGKQ